MNSKLAPAYLADASAAEKDVDHKYISLVLAEYGSARVIVAALVRTHEPSGTFADCAVVDCTGVDCSVVDCSVVFKGVLVTIGSIAQ
ncbi:hypothetical protein E2C01_010795 [Portunus trituberculatus]|uniref:Uncharacterized protein n=1 Tax=Portunus trituberculatus TaxID=210409 RepID=A0A5B7D9T8_PORTR|nr:hypothetical protein [Portunus trituberculatus]